MKPNFKMKKNKFNNKNLYLMKFQIFRMSRKLNQKTMQKINNKIVTIQNKFSLKSKQRMIFLKKNII